MYCISSEFITAYLNKLFSLQSFFSAECYVCNDFECLLNPIIVNCTADQPYCMTTVTDTASGGRTIQRG